MSWTVTSSLNTARWRLAGCGNQASSLSFGGAVGSVAQEITEQYNGNIWTAANDLNTGRYGLAGCIRTNKAARHV